MANRITCITLAICNYHLMEGDGGYLFIDTGLLYERPLLWLWAKLKGIDLQRITHIVITHAHPDHVANAAWLARKSGAKVLVAECEADILTEGRVEIPAGRNGFGRFASWVGRHIVRHFMRYRKVCEVERVTGEMKLEEYNVTLVPTPGHTVGSMSVVVEGEAISGDLVLDNWFAGRGPSIFLNQPLEVVHESWRTLLSEPYNVTLFRPGHGKPIPRERVERWLEKAERAGP